MLSVAATVPSIRNLETPAMSAYRALLIRGVPEHIAAETVLACYPSAKPARTAVPSVMINRLAAVGGTRAA